MVIFLQPVWDAETTQVFRARFKAVGRNNWTHRGYMPAETASFAQVGNGPEWKSPRLLMSV